VNKFGDCIASAHAALTAEGDSKVLHVKVCKDMVTNIMRKGHKLPQMQYCPFRQIATFSEVTQLDVLLDLLKFRETMLFEKLLADTKKQLEAGKSQYQILMRETSDTMQDLAISFGERNCMEYCIKTLGSMKNAENQKLMTKVFRLYGCEIL